MKCVIYNVFCASNAPKASEELLAFLRKSYGASLSQNLFPTFALELSRLLEAANKGKVKIKMRLLTDEKYEVTTGTYQFFVESTSWGERDIARISYIVVDKRFGVAVDGLKVQTFDEWHKQAMDIIIKRRAKGSAE